MRGPLNAVWKIPRHLTSRTCAYAYFSNILFDLLVHVHNICPARCRQHDFRSAHQRSTFAPILPSTYDAAHKKMSALADSTNMAAAAAAAAAPAGKQAANTVVSFVVGAKVWYTSSDGAPSSLPRATLAAPGCGGPTSTPREFAWMLVCHCRGGDEGARDLRRRGARPEHPRGRGPDARPGARPGGGGLRRRRRLRPPGLVTTHVLSIITFCSGLT